MSRQESNNLYCSNLQKEKDKMFDEKKLLSHKENQNPYGLHDAYGYAFSLNQTIEYFKSIKINNNELKLLNDYILEDVNHSFYDNPYSIWDEKGYAVDFITGLRTQQNIYLEYQSQQLEFECRCDQKKWLVKITDITNFKGYIRFTVRCNGNIFYTYAGIADNELWICFPQIEKSTTLSSCSDVFWNSDELYRLLKNKKDAISISESIHRLEKQIVESI